MFDADQIARYRRDGFLLCPGLLTTQQVALLRDLTAGIASGSVPTPPMLKRFPVVQVEPTITAGAASASESLDQLRKINYPSHVNASFRAIAGSDPIVDRVAALLGSQDIVLLGDQIFMKPPLHGSAKEYHQDSASWPHLVPHHQVTVWIALDDATLANGCLRYLPGSHELGLILERHLPYVLSGPLQDTEQAVEVPAGSAIFHHSLVLHTSGPNTTPQRRRGWALHYLPARSLDLRTPDEVFVDYLLVRGRTWPGYVNAE